MEMLGKVQAKPGPPKVTGLKAPQQRSELQVLLGSHVSLSSKNMTYFISFENMVYNIVKAIRTQNLGVAKISCNKLSVSQNTVMRLS